MIFDIGAYKGNWTKMCLKIFPSSDYYLFEPQDEMSPILNKIFKDNITIENSVLGNEDGKKVDFYQFKTSSSVLKFGKNIPSTKKVTKSLDTFVKINK